MHDRDRTKRDMTVIYGERTFTLRASRQGGFWHGVVIEDQTPISCWLEPAPNAAACFADAVAFVAASIDAAVDSTGTAG